MKYLGFTRAQYHRSGVRIAEACFEERSALPISAACVVANGVRETLATLLACSVNLRLFEPIVPAPDGWREIERDALMYGISGRIADAAVIVRSGDATRLARAAFGERDGGEQALSPLERTVFERAIGAISASLASICGPRTDDALPVSLPNLKGFVTYFELVLGAPIACRIGIALSRDPHSDPRGVLNLDDLYDVPLELTARLDLPTMTAGALFDLEPGDIMPMNTTAQSLAGTLWLGGWPIADGECGVSAKRYAIALGKRVAC